MAEFKIPPPPQEEVNEFKIPPPPEANDITQQNMAANGFVLPPVPEKNKKLSEAELKENPEWIRAAKSIYEWNEGRNSEEFKKLNSDKQYADYALRYMGWFNYNIPKMGKEALDLKTNANQQQREDFVTLMDMYDNKKTSLAGTGRLVKGLAFDPSTYVGIGTFGAGLLAREGAKQTAKQGIKEIVKEGAKQGAKIGAIEGAAYSTVDNALRQSARIMSGQREGFDFGESGKSAVFGAGFGVGLGGGIGGTAAFVKNKGSVVPSVIKEGEDFVLPPKPEELKQTFVGPKNELGDTPVVETPKVETPPEKIEPVLSDDTKVFPNFSKEKLQDIDYNSPRLFVYEKGTDKTVFKTSFVTRIPIDDYLKLTTSSDETIKNITTTPRIKSYGKFDAKKAVSKDSDGPFLQIDEFGKVTGHEGRTRAILAKDAGANTMPVEIKLKEYTNNKIDFEDIAEEFYKKNNKLPENLQDLGVVKLTPQKFKKTGERKNYEYFLNETPKVETPKRGTKIPEILQVTKKPKVRMARDYIGKVSDESGELKDIFEDSSGKIQRKFKPGEGEKGLNLDGLDEVQARMQADGFYNQLETELNVGQSGSSKIDMSDQILEDLNNNTIHRDDQLLLSVWEKRTDEAKEFRKLLDDNNINYRGMTDEEVLQKVDDINNNRIDLRPVEPKSFYKEQDALADEFVAAEGGNINKVKADDIIDTPDGKDFQTDTTVDLNDRLVEVGVKIMDDLEIPRNPEIRISDQLEEVLFQAEGNPVAREKLNSVLEKNNITLPELSQLFRGSIADSARRMQKLSAVSRSIQNLSEKIGKTAKPETWPAKLYNFIKQADNIRRGLLVSQIATAMRNNTAQLGRVSMKTMIDVFDNTLKQTFNPVRKAFGAEEAPVNYARSFELILNLTKNKKQAKDLTDLLTKYYVKDAENLFTRYSSDIADASQTSNAARVIKVGQKVTDGLNILNRMQEFWYRRAVFANTMTDALLKKGIDINKVGISDDLLKYVNKADIEKAVDDALHFTYAKTPDVPIVKSLVDAVNSMPFLATGVIPFPRFMANAVAFQFRHSPLGFSALLTPKEIAKLKAGDYKTLSQAVVGTTLLLTSIEAKRKGSEDNKWYEVETSSGKTVDMRPYFPLTPYLLVADMIVRSESGRGAPDAKDVLQGLTGAQFRAGASIQLVQNALDGMSGLDTEEKINKFMSDYTSNVLGGYLTPIRMFGDFVDQDQQFRRPLPTGEFLADTTNQLKSNVPFVRDQFPESESPTREAAPGRPDTVQIPFTGIEAPGPLVRQLTGATVREEKNVAEREFDRLGFKRRDILPYSGNAIVDQTRAKYMGKPVEIIIGALVESPIYKSKTNAEKDALLRKTLQEIRKSANDYIKANKINEEAFQKAAFNRQPKYIKKLLAEKGITWKTFNDTSNGENR